VRRLFLFLATLLVLSSSSPAQQDAPTITKLDPPNWWVNLTPDVMLLLTGTHLQATHLSCNLQDVTVSRSQSSANGNYLFIWLKFAPTLKSGTAICRVTTPNGETTFELPLAARKQILGRNQGISLDDVIYLIRPDRFANGDPTNDDPHESPGSYNRANSLAWHGGDLRGVRNHLPYLKDLGVTTIALTPVLKNGAVADLRGYAAVDLYDIDPHLGTLADIQDLVEASHKQRMKIFMDIVPAHVGRNHPWIKNPPMPDWLNAASTQTLDTSASRTDNFYGQQVSKEVPNLFLESIADPHASSQLRNRLPQGQFSSQLANLNTENPIVADYLIQNSIWWAETTGLDGYRLDDFAYTRRSFWQQWHTAVRKLYPRLSTVGEVSHPDSTVTSFFVGGRQQNDGIDTQLTTILDSPLYFAIRDVLFQNALSGKIPNILRQDSLYPHPEYLVNFFDNLDTPRLTGVPGANPAKLKLAFGLILTLRGIPELYYGDEIALPAVSERNDHSDFPGGWPDDPKNAFSAAGRTPEQRDVYQYVQSLLLLRREHEALRTGKLWHLAADDSSYVFLRESDTEKLLITFNNSPNQKPVKISLRNTPAESSSSISLLQGEAQSTLPGRELTLLLPPQSLSIFKLLP
jgi:glycosidase